MKAYLATPVLAVFIGLADNRLAVVLVEVVRDANLSRATQYMISKRMSEWNLQGDGSKKHLLCRCG